MQRAEDEGRAVEDAQQTTSGGERSNTKASTRKQTNKKFDTVKKNVGPRLDPKKKLNYKDSELLFVCVAQVFDKDTQTCIKPSGKRASKGFPWTSFSRTSSVAG